MYYINGVVANNDDMALFWYMLAYDKITAKYDFDEHNNILIETEV